MRRGSGNLTHGLTNVQDGRVSKSLVRSRRPRSKRTNALGLSSVKLVGTKAASVEERLHLLAYRVRLRGSQRVQDDTRSSLVHRGKYPVVKLPLRNSALDDIVPVNAPERDVEAWHALHVEGFVLLSWS